MRGDDDAPGIRAREAEVEGARWAVVGYEEAASRQEWCEEGHRGYVIWGEIEYESDDDREPLRASLLHSVGDDAAYVVSRIAEQIPARMIMEDDSRSRDGTNSSVTEGFSLRG